ncbi:hypothetical protein BJX70DRAFT_246322 [Aspergillus crustosus]
MTFKALLFVTRKPGLTPTEFRTHYDTVHLPLIQSLGGADFPLSHKRLYLSRPDPGADNSYPATTIMGSPEDFPYDCITELTFVDEAGMRRFFRRRMEDGVREVVEKDEGGFMDSEKMKLVVLGGVVETTGSGSV